MNAALVRLSVRRTLSLRRIAVLILFLLLLAYFSPPAAWLLRIADDPESAQRGFALQTIWSGSLALLLPLVVLNAAQIPIRWRNSEAGWLSSRPGARTAAIPCAWFGTMCGSSILLATILLVAELAAGSGSNSPGWIHAGELTGVPRGIVPENGLSWTLRTPISGQLMRARVRVGLAPGDSPFATAVLRVRGDGGETSTQKRLIARGELELELPSYGGEVEFRLSRVGPGAALVIREPTIELFRRANTRFDASLSLALHAWLALAAWIAIAIGLGSWLGAGYAAGLLAAPLIAFWLEHTTPALVPGGALPRILANLHDGRAAAFPSLANWLGSAASIVVSACLAVARARWERGAR